MRPTRHSWTTRRAAILVAGLVLLAGAASTLHTHGVDAAAQPCAACALAKSPADSPQLVATDCRPICSGCVSIATSPRVASPARASQSTRAPPSGC